MNIKLVIEYQGGSYFGWQRQPNVDSVQEEIESAIQIILNSQYKKQNNHLEYIFDQSVLYASGRTDAGVHARGQVANFYWPDFLPFYETKFLKSINSIVPDKISIISAKIVPDTFHARKSALSKTYSYKILNRLAASALDYDYCWHIYNLPNYEVMLDTAKLFIGKYNFESFRASDCNAISSVREIYSSEFIKEDHSILNYKVRGSGFLKNQVRFMVGALVAIGQDKYGPELIIKMLAGEARPNYELAPAKGLCLESVSY